MHDDSGIVGDDNKFHNAQYSQTAQYDDANDMESTVDSMGSDTSKRHDMREHRQYITENEILNPIICEMGCHTRRLEEQLQQLKRHVAEIHHKLDVVIRQNSSIEVDRSMLAVQPASPSFELGSAQFSD